MSTIYGTRWCCACGAEFIPNKHAGKQRACSKICTNAMSNLTNARGMTAAAIVTAVNTWAKGVRRGERTYTAVRGGGGLSQQEIDRRIDAGEVE